MRESAPNLLYAHDTSMNIKRVPQPQPQTTGVSKNVVIGIILGIIALITCGVVAFLLWRLARQKREDSRRKYTVDLLEPERFTASVLEEAERGVAVERWNEKPLPPRPISIMPISHGSSNGQDTRHSIPASRHSTHVSTSHVPIIRPSSTIHRQETVTSNSSIDPNDSSTGSSSTIPRSRSQTALSTGGVVSHNRSNSNPFGTTEASTESDIARGQFVVVNVTESDIPRFQRPQLVYAPSSRIRGRDAPFPSRKERPESITLPQDQFAEVAGSYPLEKQGFPGVTSGPPTPGPSYTVLIPPPSASAPGATFAPPRAPFTITASRPLSNVVVEEMRAIRRPDGTQGKGRMVTMSVLVEDSEGTNSDIDALENRRETPRESNGDSDVLGQVLESYAFREGDLPPYTPR